MESIQGFYLSPQQQRTWEWSKAGVPLACRAVVRLPEAHEPEAVADALAELVEKHEILHTRFQIPEQMAVPLQVIAEPGEADFPEVVELDSLDALGPPLPFDPERGPRLRAALVREGDQRLLALDLDPLCGDRRSLELLASFVTRALGDEAGDETGDDEVMQYADFAEWRNHVHEEEEAEDGLAYWERQSFDPDEGLRLPLEPEGAGAEPAAVHRHRQSLPTERSAAVDRAAEAASVTPEVWLLTAFSALLARLSDVTPIPLALFCTGRELEELEEAIGPYGQSIPLAIGLDTRRGLGELARHVGAAVEEARTWQDYCDWQKFWSWPAYAGVGDAKGSMIPFGFEYDTVAPGAMHTVFLDPVAVRLTLLRRPSGLDLELTCRASRLDARGAQRLLEQFIALIETASEDPRCPVRLLPLLGAEGRRRMLHEPNAVGTARPLGAVFVDRHVEHWAAETPERLAILGDDGTLSFAELEHCVGRLAHALRHRGVGPEVLVAVFLPRSPELVMAILAVLRAGGAYLPLDSDSPPERLSYVLEDSGAALVLTTPDLAAGLDGPGERVVVLEELLAADGPAELPPPDRSPDHLAYAIYTSGSTGRPKGTLLTHRGLSNYLSWCLEAYAGEAATDPEAAGAPLHSPLAFDLTITSLFTPLISGRSVVLTPESLGIEALASVLRGGHTFRCVKLTPAHLRVLREQLGTEETARPADVLVIGGEALFGENLDWLRPTEARVFNEYGPTEAVVGCCVREVDTASAVPGAVPIGRPIPGMALHVLDPNLEPLPVGVSGELFISGVGLARGYLGRPGLTAASFLPDPHQVLGMAGGRLYRTGDLARYLPDDSLEFLGRRDHQVKIHGFRIEPGEIEAVLLQHPAVGEAAVLLHEETPGHPRLIACWTGDDTAEEDLGEHLRRRLPEYMVPQTFVRVDAMPWTANRKVDRRALLDLARTRMTAQRAYRAPRSEAEQTLAEIWAELLPVDRAGLDDHFFQLGGDSILSLQVIGRASRRGLRLTARQIFDHPTLEAMAEVAAETAEAAIETDQRPLHGPVKLTPVQRAFLAQHRSADDPAQPHHYNLSLLLEVREPFELTALGAAVEALAQHHDALRLRFEAVDGEWRASVDPPSHHRYHSAVDFSALPRQARRAALEGVIAPLQTSLDLERGPLFRGVTLRLGGDTGDRLLLVVHHLSTDGVSSRILLEDLAEAARAARAGGAIALQAKTTSIRTWAERLETWATSPELRRELPYWTDPRWRRAAALPGEGRAADHTVGSARTLTLSLEETTTRALLREVHGAYNTEINDVLLAALGLALSSFCGGGPVVVDLEGHGREEVFPGVDLSRTVGWLTSVFPLLLDLSAPADRRERQALIAAKEALRQIPHRGLGYGVLRHLAPESAATRALAHGPDPEVSFNYLGQLGGALGEDAPFAPAGESAGPSQSSRGRRCYLLEVNAHVSGGRLHVEWRHQPEVHDRAAVEALAESYFEELRRLADHCRSPGAGALTPSDFPRAAGITQDELDTLHRSWPEMEDIYPLSPMQEGMLLHTLSFPDSSVGFEQSLLSLPQGLDVGAMRRAWARVVERHSILRTAFAWRDTHQAWQVVSSGVDVPWQEIDGTGWPAEERATRMAEILGADRRRGFDLGTPPLLRLSLIPLPGDRYELLWSRHHVLLDGWSTALVLGELETLYRAFVHGDEAELPEPRPYGAYIEWLGLQDEQRTEAYWRHTLDGFSAPTRLPRTATELAGEPVAHHAGGRRWISAETADALRRLAAEAEPAWTLNTLVQAAWGLLLARFGAVDDVVFGATISGRPAELEGVESMVGLFIKNLPVRLRPAPTQSLRQVVDALQRDQLELREHEAASPPDVQTWSQVPAHRPLFESLVVYENYPVDESLESWEGDEDDDANDSSAAVHTAYPLTLVVAQRRDLLLHLVWDRRRLDDTAARGLLEHLEKLLSTLAEAPDTPVDEIPLWHDPAWRRWLDSVEAGDDAAGPQDGQTADDAEQRRLRARLEGELVGRGGDVVEHQLTAIWEEVLGVSSIDPDADFFTLGGTSVTALRLASQIQRRLGRDLPLAALYETPNVRALARRWRKAPSGGWSPLVTIRPSGEGRPLFAIHPVGGNVLCFVDLAAHLAPGRPFYALQAPGVASGRRPHRRMDAMVDEYLGEIRRVQPWGPYHLCGLSFGGYVAFALAHRLLAEGEEVGLVALLDTASPRFGGRSTFAEDVSVVVATQASLIARAAGKGELEIDPAELRDLGDDEQIERTVEILRHGGAIPRDVSEEHLARTLALYQGHGHCLETWEPETYLGEVCLARPREEQKLLDEVLRHPAQDAPDYGWPELVRGSIRIVEVPGDHSTMIFDPHAQELAHHLDAWLGEADPWGHS